jgi:SAM-dependent methyltransferase
MNPNINAFSTERYAKNIESHPYHRLYNHPALISLLPPLKDKQVLDAGCGTGFFLEYFAASGATVTGLDVTPSMIERCKTRVPQAIVLQADIAQALPFESEQFDLVFCSLTLQYLESWNLTFAEFNRILKANGLFIFSVHHPFEEFKMSGKTYFNVEERKRKGGQVSFRRSLSSMTETLYQTGFVLERLLEPLPETAYAETDPEDYHGLLTFPGLLAIKAVKRKSLA